METDLFGTNKSLAKELTLSAAQQLAVTTLDKDLCVAAGAGSGKTTVLVERFLHIVQTEGVRPDEIVAITFMEKAANNMKKKLVEKFTELGLLEERRRLENAFISTIHGFAARLLRENPVEARVDPGFRVIKPEEAELVMDTLLDRVMEEESERPEVLTLLAQFRERSVREALKTLYEKARSYGADPLVLAQAVTKADASNLWEETKRAVEDVLSAQEGKGKTFLHNQAVARQLKTHFESASPALDWVGLETVKTLNQFQLRGTGPQIEAAREAREKINDALLKGVEILGWEARDTFLSLYETFVAAFESRKKQFAWLDFEDLLSKAHELFSAQDPIRQAVRKRYQEKFKHLMIDEYQDTSRLQDQWLECLRRERNLFVVGDAKQSIYLFRNAELEVFLDKATAVESSVVGERISLNENYRSRAEVLGFVNTLFGDLWEDDAFKFEALIPKRNFLEKDQASVEILCVKQNKAGGEDKDTARVREAAGLANRIKAMVEDDALKMTNRDGAARPVSYGDIAILFRVMTHANLYEQELRQAQIPFSAIKGRGFYERQEVRDLINWLRVIERPAQDVPLAGVLRSALVNCSDDGLYWLARAAKATDKNAPLGKSLRMLDEIEELSKEDRVKLCRFKQQMEYCRTNKDHLKIAEIIDGIIEQTQYDVKVLGKEDGRRKLANVMKLVELARDFESQEAFSVGDFIHYVEELCVREIREAEAPTEHDGEDVVKLLSIHGAKGLEFPIVILADLGAEPGKSAEAQPFVFSETNGIAFKAWNPLTRETDNGWTYHAEREQKKAKQRLEQIRLFYVAMTRAEEHMILSGVDEGRYVTKKDYTEMASWMDWLQKALGYREHLEAGEMDWRGTRVAFTPETEPQITAARAPASEKEPFERLIQQGAPHELGDATVWEHALHDKQRAFTQTRDLPVSALLLYNECPNCFRRQYEKEIPDSLASSQEAKPFVEEQDNPNTVPGREFGNEFHRFLEYADFKKPFCDEWQRLQTKKLDLWPETARERLKETLERFYAHEETRKLSGATLHREIDFVYRLPRGTLRGQIDLVVERADQTLKILDYKTEKIKGQAAIKSGLEHHRYQLLIYALALKDIIGRAPKEGVVYFSAVNEYVTVEITEQALRETRERLETQLQAIIESKVMQAHAEGCRFA